MDDIRLEFLAGGIRRSTKNCATAALVNPARNKASDSLVRPSMLTQRTFVSPSALRTVAIVTDDGCGNPNSPTIDCTHFQSLASLVILTAISKPTFRASARVAISSTFATTHS